MGTSLTGLTPATTYDALLKVGGNSPLTSSLQNIGDGLGNNSALNLSTVGANIQGTLSVSSTLSASNLSGTNTGDETQATIKSKLGVATTSVDGYLTSTDWTTFNNKQVALSNPITGVGTRNTNYLPKFSGSNTTIANSLIVDDGSKISVNLSSLSNDGLFILEGLNQSFQIGSGENIAMSINASGVINTTSTITGTTITGTSLVAGTSSIASNKLTITNIGASGTLNVGSTTTATKLLELTADNSGGVENNTLRFVNSDTTILANEVIGKIEFYSADASSPSASVKAYISASATTTSPNGYLDFATDQLTGTPTVRQRIQADGTILVGTTTDNGSTNMLQVNGGFNYNIVVKQVNNLTYTFVLGDSGKYMVFNNASAQTITVPTNASVAFPIGTQIYITQRANGVPTINGDTGVTINTRSTTRQPFGRYAEIKLVKTNTDEWYLTGDLKA